MFIEARELFNKYKEKGKLIENSDTELIYDISHLNVYAPSLNKNSCKLERRRISKIWQLKADNLLNIKLSTGVNIKVTPEHPFLLLSQNGEIIEKRADELKKNDFVICPRSIEYNALSKDNLKEEILKALAKDEALYVILNKELGEKIKHRIFAAGTNEVYKTIKSKLTKVAFSTGVRKRRYRVQDFVALATLFSIPLHQLYDSIKINYRSSFKKAGKSSLFLDLPKIEHFTDFAYLLGLIWGDGGVCGADVRITNNSKEIQQVVFKMVKKIFNKEAKIRFHPNRAATIYLSLGKTFQRLLVSVFELPQKDKAHNIRVPKLIQKAPKDIIRSFIQGYYDADGTIERARKAVSISSVSFDMLKDLQLLFLKFGCLATFYKKKSALYISGSNVQQFYNEIGFKVKDKQDRLINFVKRCTGANTNTDMLPAFNFLKQIRENLSLSKTRFFPAYGRIESGVYGLNSQSLRKALDIFKVNVGNPEPKDAAVAEKIKHLEKIIKQIFTAKVLDISKVKERYVYDFTIEQNHNFIANGMVVHNTTLSDSLLAGAGMISEELAGKLCYLDFDEQEKARGITINAANVSMVHKVGEQDFLINLIDTPGHIDFSGDVTRAMRAVDGAVVLACAVEGVMPQTETVLRQAIKEGVKPVLFINKVDRLIRELKLTPEKMQERFIGIINGVNELIKALAPKKFKESWQVSVSDGSVCFGSAFHKWAVSIPMMKKKNVTFADIIKAYEKEEEWRALCGNIPLHEAVLDMVVKHIPNPVETQNYRIPIIWRGGIDSEVGKALINCDPNGPLIFVATKVTIDPQAGEIVTGRLFSGAMQKGMEAYLNRAKMRERIQQVSIYKGQHRILIDKVLAGNIVGVTGLKNAASGETVSIEPVTPFESIKHLFEPVVTKAIEAKNPKDLPKLIEVLKDIAKQDPTVKIAINEETGENLISGLGELHLEIWEYRIKHDKNLEVVSSPPIVVYRETVKQGAGPFEGKSPNRHNKLYVSVEPLEKGVYEAIKAGTIPEGKFKKKKPELVEALTESGMDRHEAKQVVYIHKGNVLVEATRGIVHIGEILEMVMEAFEEMMDAGPLVKEPCYGLKIRLTDAKLHEDSIHRGPGQIIPATRIAIMNAMLIAGDILYEPIQTVRIDAPMDYLGAITKLIASRRGQLIETTQADTQVTVRAKQPVAEMFGYTSALRSATSGRGAWFLVDQTFDRLPTELQGPTIQKIRERKGLPKELPKPIMD